MDLSHRVRFFALVKRQEGEEYAVGRVETGTFIYLPRAGVDLIELLEQGMTMAEAAAAFQRLHGETPDVADFAQSLSEVGFIEATGPDWTAAEGQAAQRAAPPAGHFAAISQRAAARIFTRPLLMLYLLFILGGLVVMLAEPRYLPRSIDQLWHPWLMVSGLSLAVFGWARTFVHELFHLLAARAKGLSAHMGLGRRFLTPVATTEIPGIYAVGPEDRYLPYLAGLIWDGLLSAGIIYLLLLSDRGLLLLPPGLYLFLKGALVTNVMAITWQLRLPLRTDLYYVAANWLQARNLHGDAVGYLNNLWARLRGRPAAHDLSGVPAREMRVIRLYAPILVGGVALYWTSFVYLTLPFLMKAIPLAFQTVMRGWADDPWSFGDSLIFLLLMGIQWGWVGYVALRDHRQERGR